MKEPARIALNWAIGLPVVAGLIAWGFLPFTPWWLQLILATSALGIVGFLFHLSSSWLFGPVLRYELVRLARSPRVPALRMGYALLLLLAMFLVYLSYTPGSGSERTLKAISEGAEIDQYQRARFAASFFYTFQILQFLMLLLFTPAMIGGSIASEKQRGTLDLLLTTDLNNREIVLGKLGSQLAYLFLLLLTGLPILSILQMLGGVDPNLLIVSFLGTVLSLITLGTVSMACATMTKRVQEALTLAYGLAVAHAYFTGNGGILMVVALEDGIFPGIAYLVLGVYALYNFIISGTALYFTFRWLRPKVDDKRRRPVPRPRPPRQRPARRPPPPRYKRPERPRPPLGDRDPMLWKELYYERSIGSWLPTGLEQSRSTHLLGVLGAGLLLLLLMCCLPPLLVDDPTTSGKLARFSNGLALYLGVPIALLLLVLMALRGASAYSREREAQTFDSLFTTALTAQEIYRAKWVACVWGVRLFAIPLGAIYVIALCTGGVYPWAFPLVLLAAVVHAAFVINLGLYCSAASTSTLRSTIATMIAFVLLTGGHWLLALVLQPLALALSGRFAAEMVYDIHLWSLTLPCNLAALSFYSEDIEKRNFALLRLFPGVLGLLYYSGLALLFRWGIFRRLRQYRDG